MPTPPGQKLHLYWESWMDVPPVPYPLPDDFRLSRIPAYVEQVVLSFGVPLCTYQGLGDDIKQTVGLNWRYSAQLLRDTLDLLRSRNPGIKIMLGINQTTPDANDIPALSPWASFTGAVTLGSAIVENVSSMTDVFAGLAITGAHIPDGTTIMALDPPGSPPNSLLLSRTATATDGSEALSAGVIYSAGYRGYRPQAYFPLGFGGMTAAHVACMRQFCDDMGLAGVVIDYENLPPDLDPAHHCWDNPDGTRSCYTDTEMISVVNLVRAGLPSPYLVFLDALHVGAYGQVPYRTAAPFGWNSGYNLALSRDAGATAALDGIHIMSYDAGVDYDPTVALAAYQHFFPATPLYLGLRVGPPEVGPVKRTMADFTTYLNQVVLTAAAGVFIYSMQWPDIEPTGDIGPDYPNAVLAAWLVASQLGLPESALALVTSARKGPMPRATWSTP